jgi:hypothetical protein
MRPDQSLTELINEAWKTGSPARFIYNDITYEFSPEGLIALVTSSFADLPTADPEVIEQLWNNLGVVTISAGEVE